MKFIADNIQKILGSFVTVQGLILSMIASGTFEGLMSQTAIRWMGVILTIAGAAVTGSGFVTTAKVKLASAMETAINARPGDPVDAPPPGEIQPPQPWPR